MDIIVFRKKTFKWNEVLESRYALAGNGYVNQLKEYYRINNDDDYKLTKNDTVISNAFSSKSLDVIKFIIEELHYDYNSYGCFDSSQYKLQDLLYTASKYGSIEMVKYIDSLKNSNNINNSKKSKWNYIESFKVSPLSKDIKVLQYLYDRLIDNQHNPNNDQIKSAILNSLLIGRIDMVEWLITQSKNSINLNDIKLIDENLISKAALNGYLDTIKWLHEKNIGVFKRTAMDNAAQNGHFEIIRWLNENRTEGCSKNAIDNAAWHGHFQIVKWLHFNRTEGCTTDAIDYAAECGYFEIVKWLHENRTEGCSTDAMDNAAENGHFEIVKWLHYNDTEGCTDCAMSNAAKNGHFEIVKWLLENRTEGCVDDAMNNAADNGYLEIEKWLLHNGNK